MASQSTHLTARDGEHAVHFYTRDAELIEAVGAYLVSAAQAGAVAIVIATEPHRRAFAAELESDGIDLDQLAAAGRFISLDAATVLASFTHDGRIDRRAFHEVLGGLLGNAVVRGSAVRVYGEMVALLWQDGEVLAAIELERLWNELAEEHPFTLFCAYPAASVAGPEHAEALREVCRLHSQVWQPGPEDPTGGVAEQTALELRFAPEDDAPARARHLILEELSRAGCEQALMDDVALVVSELATNAVVHAGSPFTVSLDRGDSAVRVTVRDRRPLPTASDAQRLTVRRGHGLDVIGLLSVRWGVEVLADGKAVWAELLHDRTITAT